MLSLSVVVPVYNERYLVCESLRRVLAAAPSWEGVSAVEVLVVEDGSTDGTRELLREFAAAEPRITLIEHERNSGKGAAVRTGIAAAQGDLIVFHDADLEYDARDIGRLVKPFLEDGADVVYGSRFSSSERRRVLYYRHTLGNKLITFLSDMATDLNLTDVETCYKMFRSTLLKSLPIRSNDFRLEIEVTAKIAKRQARIFEVPVSYVGRTYREGKKIGWRDGFRALAAILKYWVVDDLYTDDPWGGAILHNLERAQRFNRWMADAIRPYLGNRVLEIGAGIGNLTHWLLPRERYVASDINSHYLHYLRNATVGKPYLEVARVDLEDPACFAQFSGQFDCVVCLNVLEHVRDPLQSLRNAHSALAPGGRLVLYVPQGQGLYSTLDEALAHRIRYDRRMLADELARAGFALERCEDFNRASVPAWWLNGKVLRRRNFSRLQLKGYDWMVPLLRRFDRWIPWRGLGLIAVARKPADAAGEVEAKQAALAAAS
ncbi:MAG TPA: glycosyltransferase [Thermoanaerobaculia bacterium]|nr:glycosyltransferase [Thermoanaerobaculia bacterium]